jgi:hypothetical protein
VSTATPVSTRIHSTGPVRHDSVALERILAPVPAYPDDLQHPLSRDEASLLGIGWREVAGSLWRSPYRGVHAWAGTDPDDPLQRVYDAAPLLPSSGAVGGWAAARLGGAHELDGRGASGRDQQPVMLCLPRDVRVRRGPDVRPFRSRLDPEDVTEVCGVRATRPLRTAFDLARTQPYREAVVAVDYLARGRPEFLGHLAEYARQHRHLRGCRRVLQVVQRASPRSKSAGETRLRLLWTLDAGLPEPEVNPEVRWGDGFLLGMPDLLDLAAGIAGEYDGAGHRAADQHASDNAREEGLESAGLVVVRFGGVDLGPRRTHSLARLSSARRRGLATDGPRQWTANDGPLPEPTPHW